MSRMKKEYLKFSADTPGEVGKDFLVNSKGEVIPVPQEGREKNPKLVGNYLVTWKGKKVQRKYEEQYNRYRQNVRDLNVDAGTILAHQTEIQKQKDVIEGANRIIKTERDTIKRLRSTAAQGQRTLRRTYYLEGPGLSEAQKQRRLALLLAREAASASAAAGIPKKKKFTAEERKLRAKASAAASAQRRASARAAALAEEYARRGLAAPKITRRTKISSTALRV